MIRVARLAFVAFVAFVALAVLHRFSGDDAALRPPLLLPVAEADCPPESIHYFGAIYEGDSIVWCIDRSGSMGWGNLLGQVQSEVNFALAQLSPAQRFGLVAFDDGFETFFPTLLPANSSYIFFAQSWVDDLEAAGNTCHAPAVIHGLGLLAGEPELRTLILVSDGAPTCQSAPGQVEAITSANVEGIPIHTIQLDSDISSLTFLASIAAENGGSFRDLTAGSEPRPDFRRGDVNGDGAVTIVDPILILELGFGLSCPAICTDAADTTDDGQFEPISDAVTLLGALFVPGHPPLAAPGMSCGEDVTDDTLACAVPTCP